MMKPRLGVNIDHIATLRQLRGTPYPDIIEAAHLAEQGGAEQITVHLREDRRHIQDEDVKQLRRELHVPLNLEMAVSPEMVKFAMRVLPDWVCLVPEKRQEVTTEGGLDVKKNMKKIDSAISSLSKRGIKVSLFIEPSLDAVRLSHELGAHAVELHTGRYCLATQVSPQTKRSVAQAEKELRRIERAGLLAIDLGVYCHAGHGFDYENVKPAVALREISGLPLIKEYNIGHAIVCRSTVVGLKQAVREMADAISFMS
jgi:pyridoxine 5-phosphate synthase